MEVNWPGRTEAHDHDAAADHLSLVGEHGADVHRRVCVSDVADVKTSFPCRLVPP